MAAQPQVVANNHPLNVTAGNLLPPEWRDPTTLHVLALMRWLLQTHGLEPGNRPPQEELEAKINALDRGDPNEAMEYLLTSDSGDPTLQALPQDREAAAMMLLQALADKMIALAP